VGTLIPKRRQRAKRTKAASEARVGTLTMEFPFQFFKGNRLPIGC